MRGVIVAEEDNYKSYYIDNIFNSVWQDGLNMNDENIIEKVLKNLNVNPKTFLLRSTSSSIKDSLKKRTSEAYEKGVFGAPSFISNNKVFWGQDRIEFALNEAKPECCPSTYSTSTGCICRNNIQHDIHVHILYICTT